MKYRLAYHEPQVADHLNTEFLSYSFLIIDLLVLTFSR